MEKVGVDLGDRSYDICIGVDMLKQFGEKMEDFKFSRVTIVSNPTVYGLYGDLISNSLKRAYPDVGLVSIPDGEEYKDLFWAYYIYGELLRQKLDRASALVALGGGVIGDIAGFAASTYMRGISFVQIPTTLLAQVDSSVGGKTGVNHPLGKNMIGTFYQPRLVWTDVGTLRTLPRRELNAGLAEVIKYGVIWDEGLFRFLEDNRNKILALDEDALGYIIKRSCEIKAEVVSRDEREGGLRAILNCGHTIGHALETATGYRTYLHGEAVAIGICLEARLSSLLGFIGEKEVGRICSLVGSYDLPVEMPSDIDGGKIISSMQLDKKAVGGRLKFILPEKIGSVRIEAVTDTSKIIKSIKSR